MPVPPTDSVAPTPTAHGLHQRKALARRQGNDEEGYPSCLFVDPAILTCYPTSNTVAVQNEYTRVIFNSQYTLFYSDDGDGSVDLYLRNAESDQQMGKWTTTRRSGVLKLPVDDIWFDDRAVTKWEGTPKNWTFYWIIVPSGKVLDGGEEPQPTFTVVQTALPNHILAASSAAVVSSISASLASVSRSLASEEASQASQASLSSQSHTLQDSSDSSGGGFPAWAIALVVVLGVVTLVSILSLVFVLQRHMRHKRRRAGERRSSMGSESPMMAAADHMSPETHPSVLPPPVRHAPSLRHDGASVHSKNTGAEAIIAPSDAARMADAFRKALRKPDFTDRPQEEGESPESNAVQTEEQLLKSELADEGRNIRSVGSERGVKVVTEDEDEGMHR